MAETAVRYELGEGVARVCMDDGKANGLSNAVIDALHGCLDRAEKEAGAVALLGREGRFSGGFDLATMRSGIDAVRGLVGAGGKLFTRFLEYPLPIVAGCTGHAIAAGAIALLASDSRIGTGGAFRIGLNEVSIGVRLPVYGYELARLRLSKRHFHRAVCQAELYDPDGAVDAGFLDRVVPAAEHAAAVHAEAVRLAALPQPAFRDTKAAVHRDLVALLRDTLDADMAALTSGPKLGG